jgi:thioesterase domain-containing protein
MSSAEQVPGVPALTDLVRRRDSHIPPIVLLKAGSASPPIFMTPGIGGDVVGMLQLAQGIGVASPIFAPIYGLQPKGIDGLEEPHDRIEDMAEYHLGGIRQVQPHGPYFLIGYSLGGAVMLEIARHLSWDGEKIALLTMLDSYPHRSSLSFGQNARLLLHGAQRRAVSLMRRGRSRAAGERGQQVASVELTARGMQRVSEYQDRAWKKYRPQFYDGKIRFVKAAICSYFPADPSAVWGPLVKECRLESVSCDHAGMVTTHAGAVASVVTRYVKEALGE